MPKGSAQTRTAVPRAPSYGLVLAEATPSNNVLRGLHFHAYKHLRRRWRLLTLQALGSAAPPAKPLERAYVVVHRHCAGALDWDNAYGGLKPLLDCLVEPNRRNPDGLGFIRDDSPRCMPYPPFMQQLPAKRGSGKTIVWIYDLSACTDAVAGPISI